MKKISCLFLILIVLSVIGCGKKELANNAAAPTQQPATQDSAVSQADAKITEGDKISSDLEDPAAEKELDNLDNFVDQI